MPYNFFFAKQKNVTYSATQSTCVRSPAPAAGRCVLDGRQTAALRGAAAGRRRRTARAAPRGLGYLMWSLRSSARAGGAL